MRDGHRARARVLLPSRAVARTRGMLTDVVWAAGGAAIHRAVGLASCAVVAAPRSIASARRGWGFQIGGEVTDMLIVLNSEEAVQAFASKAQVSLGTELSIAVGPMGRSAETNMTAGDGGVSAVFSYAHSKGASSGPARRGGGAIGLVARRRRPRPWRTPRGSRFFRRLSRSPHCLHSHQYCRHPHQHCRQWSTLYSSIVAAAGKTATLTPAKHW